MLESDFKVIRCFRHTASIHVLDAHIAESVLKGLLKIKKAKYLYCLGFEPEMVQKLIHKAVY